jgi:hypothetical protein
MRTRPKRRQIRPQKVTRNERKAIDGGKRGRRKTVTSDDRKYIYHKDKDRKKGTKGQYKESSVCIKQLRRQ